MSTEDYIENFDPGDESIPWSEGTPPVSRPREPVDDNLVPGDDTPEETTAVDNITLQDLRSLPGDSDWSPEEQLAFWQEQASSAEEQWQAAYDAAIQADDPVAEDAALTGLYGAKYDAEEWVANIGGDPNQNGVPRYVELDPALDGLSDHAVRELRDDIQEKREDLEHQYEKNEADNIRPDTVKQMRLAKAIDDAKWEKAPILDQLKAREVINATFQPDMSAAVDAVLAEHNDELERAWVVAMADAEKWRNVDPGRHAELEAEANANFRDPQLTRTTVAVDDTFVKEVGKKLKEIRAEKRPGVIERELDKTFRRTGNQASRNERIAEGERIQKGRK